MKDIDEEVTLNFEGVDKSITLRRDEFIRMALPTDSGSIDMKNFGCWLRIGNDGLYVNIDHEHEIDLTPEEAATLCTHPTGNLNEPALPFPFSVGELESFLDFTNEVGRDVPLSRKKFEEIIALKNQNRKGAQATELTQQESVSRKAAEAKPKNSDLLAIAGLLSLLLNDTRNRYKSAEGKIAVDIEANGWYGASYSQLTKLFPKAKKAAINAGELHQPLHLLVIAGLLELLRDNSRPHYEQRTAADAIAARDWVGASPNQITELFDKSMAVARGADKNAKVPKVVTD